MAITHKIFEDFCEETFILVAIHSGLEDYSLVYTLNKSLKIHLKRAPSDLDLADDIFFPFFEWKDEINDQHWQLIANISSKEEKINSQNLFENETSYTMHHLIPEYKEVDYFLKVEQDNLEEDEEVVTSILSIPKVVTAYTIDTNTMKSKQNLIF